jgi:hypothetical protein
MTTEHKLYWKVGNSVFNELQFTCEGGTNYIVEIKRDYAYTPLMFISPFGSQGDGNRVKWGVDYEDS